MKRTTPLRRTTPLTAKAELRRDTPLRKRNPERAERAFIEDFGSVARVKWFRLQECANCGAWPSECAHVRSRAAGGRAEDTIPLCLACHRLQHDVGWSALDIADPPALAAEYDARYRRAVP